ncbi:MAG: hypothetical protein PF447_07800 [Spirochaetaceae bacterium]|jgi:hypothetical protein|nr:hypothetical protein [Spirochaetaceae bacterium]
MKKILFSITFFLFTLSCTYDSLITVELDVLSFLESSEFLSNVTIPAISQLEIYLLPEIQLDLANNGPDALQSNGVIIDFPDYEGIPFDNYVVTLSIHTRIKNLSNTQSLSSTSFILYIDEINSTDIYDEGIPLEIFSFDAMAPLTEKVYIQHYKLSDLSAIASILRSGKMKMGLNFQSTASVESVPIQFEISKICIEFVIPIKESLPLK